MEAYQRYVEGLEYLARGELSKAEVVFTAALRRNPGFRQAQEYLALVEWRRSYPGERIAR